MANAYVQENLNERGVCRNLGIANSLIKRKFIQHVNSVLQIKNKNIQFGLLSKGDMDKTINGKSTTSVKNHILKSIEKVGWNIPREKITNCFCIYKKGDLIHRPLTFIMIGEVKILGKRSIQIIFQFNNDFNHNIRIPREYYINNKSPSFELVKIVLAWGKMQGYESVTSEAVAWASRSIPEELGFNRVTHKIYPPLKGFRYNIVSDYIKYLEDSRVNFDINDICKL